MSAKLLTMPTRTAPAARYRIRQADLAVALEAIVNAGEMVRFIQSGDVEPGKLTVAEVIAAAFSFEIDLAGSLLEGKR